MPQFSRKGVLDSYERRAKYDGVDLNVTPQQVFALLDSYASKRGRKTPLDRKAQDLLEDMDSNGWRILAGVHEGGLGGGGRNPDPRLHITVRVGNATYHLRLGVKDRKYYLIGIT